MSIEGVQNNLQIPAAESTVNQVNTEALEQQEAQNVIDNAFSGKKEEITSCDNISLEDFGRVMDEIKESGNKAIYKVAVAEEHTLIYEDRKISPGTNEIRKGDEGILPYIKKLPNEEENPADKIGEIATTAINEYVKGEQIIDERTEEAMSKWDEENPAPTFDKTPPEAPDPNDAEAVEKYNKEMSEYQEALNQYQNDLKAHDEARSEAKKAAREEEEAKYADEDPDYNTGKEYAEQIKQEHDEYMTQWDEEHADENPKLSDFAADPENPTQEEIDKYQQAEAEFNQKREDADKEYGKENPEYAYLEQKEHEKETRNKIGIHEAIRAYNTLPDERQISFTQRNLTREL